VAAAPSLSYDLFIPQHKVSMLQIKCDTFMKLALLVTLAIATTVSATRAADREPVPVPASTASATLDFLRGVIFCNVQLVGGTPEAGLAIHVFNTSGLNNSDDRLNTCPPERWAKVSANALKAQYDVMAVLKNGPHGWTMDAVTLPAGPVVSLNGLETRWWTMTKLPKGISFDEGPSRDLGYKPVPSRRSSTFTYQAGKPAFIIEDADGTPWVMQSFSRLIDPSLTYDSLQDLGRKLTLPKGWKYRVTVLSQDLQIKAPPGYNWIILDEFWNNYVACKEGACNFQP